MSDLISRQAAIDEILGQPPEPHYPSWYAEQIKRLPLAQTEQHHDEWCTDCKEYDKEKHSCPRWNKVIKNAVDELKSAQPEPCEDAVSRKAVQYLLAHFVDEDKYVDACDGLKHLPPVTPKQRTGKWITQDHNKRAGNISTCVYYYPICSKCGKVGIETYKYCPHCGAKMNQSDKTCDCYSDGRCVGTKEIDLCSCGGNKSKCDFYEHVRWEGGAE